MLGTIVCACAIGCTAARAQELRAGAAVTLRAAQAAAASNVDVVIARRALDVARGDVIAADHAPSPQLIAKASQMDLQHGIGGGSLLRDKRIDKSLGIDWTLERGGKREARTALALANAQAARADWIEATVQQRIAASSAFFDLLAAQEKLAQVEAISQGSQRLAQTARRRVQAGDLSRQESARVEIEAERARADVQGASADRARAQLALAQVTGLAAPLEAVSEWPAIDGSAGTQPWDIEQRADVRAARERVSAAQHALEGAAALRKSDVTLGASYDHFPGTSNRLVELRVQVPLAGGIGYGFQGEVARAQAQLAQAEAQLEKTRRAAATEMGRLAQDVQASAARAASYEQIIVPRAQDVAQAAEFAYTRGAMPLTEVLDARRTLRAVRLEDIAARADHARALAAWQLRRSEPAETETP